VNTISQVTKPRLNRRAVQLLDAGVRVGDCGGLSGDGDPVLSRRVLESDLDLLVGLEVLEFLGVVVGEVEEVRAGALGDGHGTGDWADAGAYGGHKGDLELVDDS